MSDLKDKEPDREEVLALMLESRTKSRGYATYWEWTPDKTVAEIGVACALAEYLTNVENLPFASVRSIEDDPPDVLLIASSGERVGVEVTELVDGPTIERHRFRTKAGANHEYDWADWTTDSVANAVIHAVERKDRKLADRVHQYDQCFVAIFTDEPQITLDLAQKAMGQCTAKVAHLTRAFFILSYMPGSDRNLFPQGIPVINIPLKPREP